MKSDGGREQPGRGRGEQVKGTAWQNNPLMVMVALVLLIIGAESGIMFFLNKVEGTLPVAGEMLVDSLFLVAILCPALYSLVLVPLLRQITERRLAEEALRASEQRYRFLADNLRDVIWEMDGELAFTFVSHSAMDMFGYAPEELLGRGVETVLTAATREKVAGIVENTLARQTATGETSATVAEEFECLHKDGGAFWTEVRATLIFTGHGRLGKVVGMTRDIGDRKRVEARLRASLNEKEMLLREIHHRVRNNLQIITGLLALQAKQAGSADCGRLLTGSQNRIASLSLIYEVLSGASSLTGVNLAIYIRTLLGYLSDSYKADTKGVTIEIEADEVLLDIDTAIPCGLIINELVANAFMFAFPDGGPGSVRVHVGREGARIVLAVRDDGVGLPVGMTIETQPTLGLRLVRLLVAQLEGSLEMKSHGGLECLIAFHMH